MSEAGTELHDLLADEATRQRPQRIPPYGLVVARARNRRRTRGAVLIAAATVLAAVIAGPRIFDGSSEPITGSPTPGASSGLQVRPVLEVRAATPTSCPNPDPSPSADESLTACTSDGRNQFRLGPAVVGGEDIRKVDITPEFDGGDLFVVDVTLNPAGRAALARLTGERVDNPPPTNQIAFVIDGVVSSSPSVESTIVDGVVQLSGGTKSQAQAIAAQVQRRG